ncbi:helix-turn-helix domain-containing protein [Paenibacillus favisporus]|uniref:helix-turn-helix domain-containing protein n=1 Tax=Paenibacillus favisporus TaxID=221028 RepID=UPI003D2AD360
MEEANELARQFADGVLTVTGVYMTSLQPGNYNGHTKERPTSSAGFVFALRGKAEFVFNGTAYDVRPGIVVHGGKGMTLELAVGHEGFDYVLIHYKLTAPGGIPAPCTFRHFGWRAAADEALTDKLIALHVAALRPGPIQYLRTKELFYALLFDLLTGSGQGRDQGGTGIAEQATAYIHGHFQEPLTLEQLAGLYGLGVKRFSYLFYKYTGLFPIDYLIQYRMKWAKHLLVTGVSSIGDIAAGVGYADAHYFSRLFKKHVGVTPTEFRIRRGQ